MIILRFFSILLNEFFIVVKNVMFNIFGCFVNVFLIEVFCFEDNFLLKSRNFVLYFGFCFVIVW